MKFPQLSSNYPCYPQKKPCFQNPEAPNLAKNNCSHFLLGWILPVPAGIQLAKPNCQAVLKQQGKARQPWVMMQPPPPGWEKQRGGRGGTPIWSEHEKQEGGWEGGQLQPGRRRTYLKVAAPGSVINSCHHPPAALSLSGLQRCSQIVLLSLIKASGWWNKHADLMGCL